VGGLAGGVEQPARLALVPSLVPRPHLATAVAINSIVFNSARFIGPALAGPVIVWVGVATVFALNALSFAAFLLALARLRLAPVGRPRMTASVLEAIGEGLRYTAAHAAIGPFLLVHAVLAVSARPFFELLPGFADQVFDRGAPGLATLSSTVGIGAVAGGFWLAQRSDQKHLAPIIVVNSLLIALATLGFALSTWFPVAVTCVAIAGFAMVATGVATQTLIQITVDEAVRGRVLSLFGLIFRGGPALGALIMGAASELVGLQAPLATGAVLGVGACGLLWRQRQSIARALAG
jgi:predicted MFS family arabinose efflux permease